MSNSSIGSRDEGSSTHQLSGSIVRVIFLLLGVGILMPWNAFVSAKPYFQSRLCSDDGQVIVDFELWFGLIWNLSSVLSLAPIQTPDLILSSNVVRSVARASRSRYHTDPPNCAMGREHALPRILSHAVLPSVLAFLLTGAFRHPHKLSTVWLY